MLQKGIQVRYGKVCMSRFYDIGALVCIKLAVKVMNLKIDVTGKQHAFAVKMVMVDAFRGFGAAEKRVVPNPCGNAGILFAALYGCNICQSAVGARVLAWVCCKTFCVK